MNSGKKTKKDLSKPLVTQPVEIADPLSRQNMKSLGLRLGLPVLAVWLVGAFVAGMSHSTTARSIALGIPVIVTLLAVGVVVWAVRQARKAQGVASLLRNVDSADDRKAAIEKLEAGYKKNDPAAIFAKAQLELQDDPKKALATLEQIDLQKVMAPVADEARSQRALIHLMMGQVPQARQLADAIEIKRHQEPKTRAMMAGVVAEAWARSGQAKRAIETLSLYDPEDELYEQLKPQLYRAYAYAYAHTNDTKGMRKALRKLIDHDVRLLGGFMTKKTHPLLQKEARKLVEQSGMVPRKMIVQRRP